MSKKRSNRPFRGHGSFEEEFEFEEVAMNDEPQKDTRRDDHKKAKKPVPAESFRSDPEILGEKEIDAFVAEINNAQPKMKKSRRRGSQKEQHIAANPSVNPTQTRTSIIDGIKVANTRLRVSVEDEMKSHGIKKLPNGMSAADLAIPSYDSVVTAAERRPLDCALFHEFEEGELSPLEQMMRKSAERSEKSKKKEQKAKKETEKKQEKEKKDGKKAEKPIQGKAPEKIGEKAPKQPEKELAKPQKPEKKSRSNQPQAPNQPVAAAVAAGPTIQVPTQPITQVQPAFYQTQAQGLDSHRAELLRQQEMVLQMIQQCHQTLASIQAQLLSVVPQPMVPPVVTPVIAPVGIPVTAAGIPAVPTVPVQASVLESTPSDAASPTPSAPVETSSPTTTNSGDEKAERKLSRRERIRLKKQREAQASNESEASEKTEVEEAEPVSKEIKTGKKPEKKAEKSPVKPAENQDVKSENKKHAKFSKESKDSKDSKDKEPKDSGKTSPETSISDVISAYPDEFIGPEDFDEEFNSESANPKKKISGIVSSVEEDEKTLKTPAKAPENEHKPKAKKSTKPEKSTKSIKKDEHLRQLQNSEFGRMGLSREILLALDDAQYETPSPIQQEFIPKALTGEDLMGQAQTGTGKTAAFAIPILQLIKFDENSYDPQALILVPTRELAVQVKDEIEKLAKYTDLECLALYGGKLLAPQVQALRAGVDVVIGTPGRIMDHISRRTLTLRNLKIVVLDEADRMLDIGFRPDIEKILRQVPQSRQTLLLSATIPPSVESIARKYMREPEVLNCSHEEISSETIEQFYFTVDPELKYDLLLKLINREKPRQAIIFCRTKRGVEKIANRLIRDVQGVEAIHGDLQQRRRDRVMASFRAGKTRYLVATDVIGRGIDVSGISHIINYDIPTFCDDYVHRVGRTGRMGQEGVAFTFVAPEEGNELTRIEMRINKLLKRDEIEGFSTLPKIRAASPEEPPAGTEAKAPPTRRKRRL